MKENKNMLEVNLKELDKAELAEIDGGNIVYEKGIFDVLRDIVIDVFGGRKEE